MVSRAESLRATLASLDFLAKAPAEIVALRRADLAKIEQELSVLE